MADSLLTRASAALAATVTRWLYPDPLRIGSASAVEGATSLYDARNALSAMAAFPWVKACVDVISTDLSGVPLVAVRMGDDGQREVLTDHPVLDLLRRPSPQTGGVAMRRQLYADYTMTGEAYIRVIGLAGGRLDAAPVALRLHPGDLEPQIDPQTGLIGWYKWGSKRLEVSEVLMVRGLGWERGIRSSRAVSAIQALESGLKASQEARNHARKSAARGQIQFVLKPSDPLAMFGPGGVQAVVDAFDEAAKAGRGTIVLNRSLDLMPMSLSPRDLEFSKLSDDVRTEVLAVFGVPPTVVGLPGANYGTARQEARTYWERLGHIARLFDDEFSRLTGDPRVRIEHDLTDVEALQTSRTERQQRASVWVTAFGVPPQQAARYEGFDDAPVPADVSADDVRAPRPNAAPTIEPQEERAIAVRSWQQAAAGRLAVHIADGGDVGALAELEAHQLAGLLERAGVPRDEAVRRGRTAAGVMAESVRLALDTAGDCEVSTLRVFGPDFARMVLG